MDDTPFRLPDVTKRTVVVGRTGSGKTQFGAWLLSHSAFDLQPFVIIDYKGDALLNAIDRVKEIGLGELPKEPGLYIVHPDPVDDDDAMEAWLRRVWRRENIGLYFDEAYMVPQKGAMQGILTQGRSKHIPAIVLSQRPTRVPRFVFSEADFFAIFHLNDRRDAATLHEMLPDQTDLGVRLPKYHSRWYDVGEDNLMEVAPVPSAEEIIDTIESRLAPRRKVFR